MKGRIYMNGKGLDFKHKEVINIKDGRRLRLCTRRNSRLREWSHYLYNGCKKENRYNRFEFARVRSKKDYVTKNKQKRTGYMVKEKYKYDVVCKVEI